MIELGVGFHPELTGRENVFLNAAIHGLTGPETEAIYRDIVSYSGLEHFIDVPIKNYSSGMHMRLGFAIAANLAPDILLLDEIFAVGDADFQRRCVDTVKGFLEQGKTVVFVSHSPEAVRMICSRACVLDQGELVFDGEVEAGLHFYSKLLYPDQHAQPVPHPSETAADGQVAVLESASEPGAAGDDQGAWMFNFLRQEGLRPADRVLHFGSAGVTVTEHWRSFLDEHHYVRLVNDASVFALGDEAEPFDLAVADSVFPFRPFNTVARCIASFRAQARAERPFLRHLVREPRSREFRTDRSTWRHHHVSGC